MSHEIVVAGILRNRGRVLLVRRSPTRLWYPDTWDLPGGRVEAGEEPGAALVRELAEELGVTASGTAPRRRALQRPLGE